MRRYAVSAGGIGGSGNDARLSEGGQGNHRGENEDSDELGGVHDKCKLMRDVRS